MLDGHKVCVPLLTFMFFHVIEHDMLPATRPALVTSSGFFVESGMEFL